MPPPAPSAGPRLWILKGRGEALPETWVMGLLLLLSLVPRLCVFPFNENFYGDAVIRTELAQRWLYDPHVITSYADGTFQFGPLHIYLIAFLLKLHFPKEHAGRLLSLIFGTLSVLPLYQLGRRVFDRKTGVVAALAFSVWSMHLQMSTTGGSEAVSLFLLFSMLALFAKSFDEGGRLAPILGAAVLMNFACALRYDFWLLIPLMSVLLWMQDIDKVAATTRSVFFGLLSSPFPLAWMHGNEVALGDPLYPIHYIEKFHHQWVQDGVARWGNLGYRLENLFFWPATALFTLSPLVAALGIWGMVKTYRTEKDKRWLVWMVLVPTAYFTFRSAILLNFVPIGRFTVNQVALLCPFVLVGYEALLAKRPRLLRRSVAVVAGTLAVLTPLVLGTLTYRRDDTTANNLRPVSPMSTNPRPMMTVARFLEFASAPRGGAAIIDTQKDYEDLPLAFFSNLPEDRLARFRWMAYPDPTSKDHPDYVARVSSVRPRYLVLIDGGEIAKAKDFEKLPWGAILRGQHYKEVAGFTPPYHVYVDE